MRWAEWLRESLEHAAATENNDMVVNKLLKAGADESAGWKGFYGKTQLHAAAEDGDHLVIHALMKVGAGGTMNSNLRTTGRTLLHLAIASGNKAAATASITGGASVNILDARKDAPLRLTIEYGRMLEWLETCC